jgi:hypothetical protein
MYEDVDAVLARAIKREKTKPGKHGFYELPRLHVPGLPTEAFSLASEAVAAALARRDSASRMSHRRSSGCQSCESR